MSEQTFLDLGAAIRHGRWLRSASLSECSRYRYTLERSNTEQSRYAGRVLFVGLNPSTADATRDDATVRKWMGFTERWAMREFCAINLFALRSTDARKLLDDECPVGRFNPCCFLSQVRRADRIVVCWGDGGSSARMLRLISDAVAILGPMLSLPHTARPECFGLTRAGNPRHVLMLPYSAKLEPWRPGSLSSEEPK